MRATQKQSKKRQREHKTETSREQLHKHLRAIQYAYASVSPNDIDDIAEDGPCVDDVWCPRCRYRMTPEQVQNKFRNDTVDITTGCPECGERFETSFLLDDCRFVWLCKMQTKDQFNLWIDQKKEESTNNEKMLRALKTERPEVYFNAYRYSEQSKEDITTFLGFSDNN